MNPRIVRGLDYYTKTVFEFVSGDIGAQSTVCGGGRYDGLIKSLGGADQPGIGYAMGIERLLMVLEAQGIQIPKPSPCDLYIASMGENASVFAMKLASDLRNEGFAAESDLIGRSLKAQMKYADKIDAKYSMVIGDDELAAGKAKVKNMSTGETHELDLNGDLSKFFYDQELAELSDSFGTGNISPEALNDLLR